MSEALTLARIAKLKVEIDLLRGKYTKTEDVDAIIGEPITMMLIPLERMVADLPAKMVGQPAPRMEQIIDDCIGVMRADWSQAIQDIIDQKGQNNEN